MTGMMWMGRKKISNNNYMEAERIIIIDYQKRAEALALLKELRIDNDFTICHNNPNEHGVSYELGKGMLFALVEQRLEEMPFDQETKTFQKILKENKITKIFKGEYDKRTKY